MKNRRSRPFKRSNNRNKDNFSNGSNTNKSTDTSKEDIDTFIFHQASAVVLNKLKKKLDVLDSQWFNQIENVGNTVSATIPIAISILQNENKFSYSKKYLLMGFGVGLSVAGCIIS